MSKRRNYGDTPLTRLALKIPLALPRTSPPIAHVGLLDARYDQRAARKAAGAGLIEVLVYCEMKVHKVFSTSTKPCRSASDTDVSRPP